MSTEIPIPDTTILLVDNGSTRADAAVQLRSLAQKLSVKSGIKVHPVSLKHSDSISIDEVKKKLDGIKARTFTEFMTEQLTNNKRDFIVVPLFFGESRALTSFVPDETSKLEEQFGSFKLKMTKVLYPLPDGDSTLVEILYEHAISAAKGDSADAFKQPGF